MIQIREASLNDAERILEIYSYYIKNTAVTYEYDIPTVEEFRERISHTMQRYPYLVIEQDGRIEGYAYARAYIERSACDWSCETTVYLDPGATGAGLGTMIYRALENALRAMGIVNMYAAVAYIPEEDEYLDHHSPVFHEEFGFRKIGHFRQCGYKFGRWYDLIWLEKIIGEHREGQEPVRSFPQLRADGYTFLQQE